MLYLALLAFFGMSPNIDHGYVKSAPAPVVTQDANTPPPPPPPPPPPGCNCSSHSHGFNSIIR
jgi:hypothetical protein